MRIEQERFGTAPGGEVVELYTISNDNGMSVRACTYGGIIVSLTVPDRDGNPGDVVLGHDSLDRYFHNPAYLGAIIGRFAGRISGAAFELDGERYQLDTNDGAHSLHGGNAGFDRAIWLGEPFRHSSGAGLILEYVSVDGEGGFPGSVDLRVTYTVTEANELIVDYYATADRATPINVTQHSYFDLSAGRSPNVLDHQVLIPAEQFAVAAPDLLPTGEIASVGGTAFDFRSPDRIGRRLQSDDKQLELAGGFDHTYLLANSSRQQPAAAVLDPASGRTLTVRTTAPCVHLYSGNFLDGSITGKGGRAYARHAGLCLETQSLPNSPNRPEFPSAVLNPGVIFRSTTEFAFGLSAD